MNLLALLWLVPALPLLGFVVLLFAPRRHGRRFVAVVGVGSVALAALVALLVALDFLVGTPAGDAYRQVLWTWFSVAGLAPQVAFYLDPVSLIWMLVVTFVGALIHLYAAGHMRHDDGYRRFFTYFNLFVFMMLTLVLADDLVLLFFGWEGVGLCSYLLIGFWYRDAVNGAAGRKAFIVTRVGDTALLVGLFLLFEQGHTLRIQPLMASVGEWGGGGLAAAAALLLLGGAVGKSAQLPLQTWLPDAMAGPSPVSALIHAATMVTAGVYLLVRTHALYDASPTASAVVAVIGAATLIYAGVSALFQNDIKRALAYSTVSQIGYMFLALGVGAWSAAVFHFMTHAFFKALLFLAAGVVIEAVGGEHDMRRMGGLRRELPGVYRCFVIGAASLAALPLVTAGFYSKDTILDFTLASTRGGAWLWAAGIVGSLLTGLYAFRIVFLTFFGARGLPVVERPTRRERWPLYVLATLAVVGGLVELPVTWGGWQLLSGFLGHVLPEPAVGNLDRAVWITVIVAPLVALAGVFWAWRVYGGEAGGAAARTRRRAPRLAAFFASGWRFDSAYHALVVAPVEWFVGVARGDLVEPAIGGLVAAARAGHRALSATQTGLLRRYAAVIGGGAVAALLIVLLR